MGTHLKVLSESYPMNTNMTEFRCFQKSLPPCVRTKVISALEGLSLMCLSHIDPKWEWNPETTYGILDTSLLIKTDVAFNGMITSNEYKVIGS